MFSIQHIFFIMALVLFPGMWIGMTFAPKPHSEIGKWYDSLNKPSLNPPKWVFNVVWTILYILIGASAYLVYEQYSIHPKEVTTALFVFMVQHLLNLIWTPVFFGNKDLVGSFYIIGLMLPMIVWTMFEFSKVSMTAFYLMIPYLLWVSFATFLSFSFLILNKNILL